MELSDIENGPKSRQCIVRGIEFLWAAFQLFIASPLPFFIASQYGIEWVILTGFKVRTMHLSFAVLLLFLVIPTRRQENDSRGYRTYDWVLASLAAGTVLYLFVFYDALSERVAMPNSLDVYAAVIGMLLLLEAARRAIGFPIVIVAAVFLLYSFFGSAIPGILAHKGHDIVSIVSHEWFSSEGVFGVALGVSCNFVFLYVLFGALLDAAGAGNFFMRLSFALLRGSVGGPAKASVIASGFMGMMSGSSVANTITIGSFTIPLMKKMGMSAQKAAAVEVSAGINGQVTPPVMGAAAFLMAEFLAIPYSSIVKHALVPALLVYVGLLVIVHLEACRLNMGGKTATESRGISYLYTIMKFLLVATVTVLLFGFVYVLINGLQVGNISILGLKALLKGWSIYAIALILAAVYVVTLLSKPDGEDSQDVGDASSILHNTLSGWEILKQGLHYFIPVFILVWLLIVERASSATAGFWTNIFLVFMLLTEHVIFAIRDGRFDKVIPSLYGGIGRVCSAMVISSRNMLAVAIATATAGMVVGTVGLTGFGPIIGTLVDALAGSSVLLALLVTAVICIVLGMGMPTTGCYIIVSTLVVPALSFMIRKNGMFTPPVALHLFVFYFGLMADVTPPVGIASYAAAAIAKANSFKTGVQAFLYNIKTMMVPFMFVFNGNIILYAVDSVVEAVIAIFTALVSITSISAGMQGYFFRRNKLYESVVLIVVGVVIMVPNYMADIFFNNRASDIELGRIDKVIELGKGDTVTINFERSGGDSRLGTSYVTVPIFNGFEGSTGEVLLEKGGIILASHGKKGLEVADIRVGGYVFDYMEKGDRITRLTLNRKSSNGHYVSALACGVLLLLALLQVRRKNEQN